jgi:CRISPR-associated protein Cmr6
MPDKNDVPLMYRSQLEGRCQLQRIYKQEDLENIARKEGLNENQAAQYSERWVNQWLESGTEIKNDRRIEDTNLFQAKEYTISWRFVTNGGKDDGIIRPLIAASGLPFYPGSSMKGAFRAACQREEKAGKIPKGTTDRYCGNNDTNKDSDAQPDIIRFHGGYPINQGWQKKLLDIVHPQQQWQVRVMDTCKKPSNESAFALISLYKPTLRFEISCSSSKIDWDEIWNIWEKALGYGIGCRVSSGYGLAKELTGDVLYKVRLHGTGTSSKLLNRNTEFRPNIFRAALRGHALRIFSGLNQDRAEDIVDELFGGIRSKKERVGLLGMAFHQDDLNSDTGGDVYDVTGDLIWLLLGKLDGDNKNEHRPYLQKLVENLTQFAMLLGGFGKSWRRADHLIFYPKYSKHLIGCHWDWVDSHVQVQDFSDATNLIDKTINSAKEWMEKRNFEVKQSISIQPINSTISISQNNSDLSQLKKRLPRPVKKGEWREAWNRGNVQVWGRIAENKLDSKVIPWLHASKPEEDRQSQGRNNREWSRTPQNKIQSSAIQRPEKPINQTPNKPSIYRTSLTGRLKDKYKSEDPTQIGRLWHRMYPLENDKYLEIITIFPEECTEADQLIKWLAYQEAKKCEWKKIW